MTKRQDALYKLPSFGRMTYRAIMVRAFLLYVLGVTLVGWLISQALATYFRFPPQFGEPFLPHNPQLTVPLLAAAAACVLGAIALLIFAANKRPAFFFGPLGFILAVVAFSPVYSPYAFFFWIADWRDFAELAGLWKLAQGAFWSAVGVGFLILVGYLIYRARGFKEEADTHGSAQWAKRKDIEEAGLFAKRGIILGLWEERGKRPRYVRSEGPHHVFVQGPPRSGKGVGIVQPTLLTWAGSALVHDAKGELWPLTAGWRSEALGPCLRFDPTCLDGTAARYNPLLEIRLGPREIADAQNVCDILVEPQGDGETNHWTDSAHELLLGTILHVLYAERDKSLAGVTQFLSNPARPIRKSLQAMLSAEHDPLHEYGWEDPVTGEPSATHPQVASVARAMLDRDPRELSGVLSTTLTKLKIYRDPVVAQNTETSDFRIRDLMDYEQPVSLYLTVPTSDTQRARPIVRLMFNQFLRRLTEDLEVEGGRAVPQYRHELLLMLDEFPLLGRLQFMQEALALIPGYGIRACLITQGLSQHKAVYAQRGKHESIITTCDVRVALAANDPESAEYFSKLSGVFTVHQEKRSYRGSRFDLVTNKQYISTQEHQRPLVYPDEVLRLPKDDILIFARSARPIRARRVKRFEDEALDARAQIAPPPASDVLNRELSEWEERANRPLAVDVEEGTEEPEPVDPPQIDVSL